MRTLALTVLLSVGMLSAVAQQTIALPYNPDFNADSAIGAPDLLSFLPLFGTEFSPVEVTVDGQTLTEYIQMLEDAAEGSSATDTVTIPMLPGSEPGEMLYWDGEAWMLVPTGNPGDGLMLEGTTPAWRAQRLGCTDINACNYEDEATVLDPTTCIYEDECGICGGPGALEECGCDPIADGACDCDGNQLDALNVCGGTCLEDVDGDGICDDDGNDACIGEYDACGICNGPGAIYDCGCTGIAPDACDCLGTPDVDQDGICDNIDPCIGVDDSDGDGICDDVDDCDGTYDGCGVCNGPGPIYDCGCSDIPDGDCDCAGNQPDAEGNCQDYAADTNGDGLYDTLLEPCLNQSSYSYYGHDYALVAIGDRCWFQENLRTTHYANGDAIPHLQDEVEWAATGQGAYALYDGDSALAAVYGLLYNWTTTADPRGACPNGWDVALEEEWNDLINSVGGFSAAGGALKEAGTIHWAAPNTGATNSSGFTALPAGERGYGEVGFTGMGEDAYFWMSNYTGSVARSVRLYADDQALTVSSISSQRGQSIRCIRNPAAFGCTDINFLEFDPEANVDDGGCVTPSIPGCTIGGYVEYNPQANVNDGSCQTLGGCSDTTTVSYDGYDYEVVAIGTQCWFRENLRASKYRNGDVIPAVIDPVEWSNTYTGARIALYNDETNAEQFGYLYNLYAVQDQRQLCPVGWHVSTDEEWQEMETFLGMSPLDVTASGLTPRGENEEIGTALRDSSMNGSNLSGFSGLPGGRRFGNNGGFVGGGNAYWWSPSSINHCREVNDVNPGVFRNSTSATSGKSVRCVRSVLGCMDSGACNYDPEANEDDGLCDYLSCAICNVEFACNYQMQSGGTYVNNAVCEFPEFGFDCNGDCLPEFLVDGDCVVNTEECSEGVLTMVLNPILDAGGIEVYPFEATGSVGQIYIMSTWTENGGTWPGDMGFALVSPGGVIFGVDGYNIDMFSVGYPLNETQSLPGTWNTTETGVYSDVLDPGLPLSGDGTWQLVILNGFSASSTIFFDLVIQIELGCGQ